MDQDENMSLVDEEESDPELLLAIELSMQQQSGPMEAVPASTAVENPLLAQSLQQALQQALLPAALPQGPAQPSPPAAALPPRRDAPNAPAYPSWVDDALQWPSTRAGHANAAPISIPTTCLDVVNGIFSSALGFKATVSLDTSGCMTEQWVHTAVQRIPPGSNPVLTMYSAWTRAAHAEAAAVGGDAPQDVKSTAQAASKLLQTSIARRASQPLVEDAQDDLFFEGGKDRQLFLAALQAGHLPPAFVDAMVATATKDTDAAVWSSILRDAFAAIGALKLHSPETHEAPLRALDVLTQAPSLQHLLATMLLREVVRAGNCLTGKEFESRSVLSPLLAYTALPSWEKRSFLPMKFPAQECFDQLRNYPVQRGSQVDAEIGSIQRTLQRMYAAAHEVLSRILKIKPDKDRDSTINGREIVPAWLCAVHVGNIARSEAGSYLERVLSNRRAMLESSSEGMMVGTTAVALRFCRPFLSSVEKKNRAVVHLDPAFYVKHPSRVQGRETERTLAGTSFSETRSPPRRFVLIPDRADNEEAPHFIAESFFFTQRLIRTGFVPCIHRFQALQKMLRRGRKGHGGADGDADDVDDDNSVTEGGSGTRGSTPSREEWLLADSMRAVLVDPELGNDIVQFCELTARWLLHLLSPDRPTALAAMQLVPESAVRDMCTLLQFLISQKATELLGGADIGALMHCFTAVLRATDLIPSPAVHYSVVQLLLSMLSPQLGISTALQKHGRKAFSSSRAMEPAQKALVSAVLGTGAAQTELLPALMASYVQADHVVGLDVDKDAYDKFHLRTCVDLMMMEIWRDPKCARSLDAIASSQVPKERLLFVDFCSAVLNDLVYLLKDALGRLEDIAHLEKSMADRPAWTAAPRQQREDKLRFYASQQRAATGFLSQAVTTLDMLNTLVASSAVQTGFVSPEVVSKSAGAAFHFIDLMVGPCCAALRDLRTPERYGFDPDALLLGVVTFTLRLAEHASFRGAMAHVPDYDGDVLSRAFDTLSEKQLGSYEHRTRLEALQASVDAKKEPRDEALVIVVNSGKAVDSDEIAVDAATLEAEYVAVLGPLAVGEFDAALPRAYNRHFAQMAEAGTGGGDSGQTAKRLAREMRDLRGKMTLPVHAAGAVYVRHDAHRLDIIRACVTGPEGTPYEGGLFFFDVFAPSGYPQIPPLLELETTGGGVARFNPNLYADGKVCLSLLGTWHGGAASEKWNPATSSLWQVFLSIQGMILVPEPYFNEPAYEGMRGTPEGEAASLRYNFEVQLNTIRFAIIDVLKHPRPGFEQVVTSHFRVLRPRILATVNRWVIESVPLGEAAQGRLRRAAAELRQLLSAL